MRKFLFAIEKLFFWGSVFLLILLFGFNVALNDIMTTSLHGKLFLNVYCIYMLLSVPLFVITYILDVNLAMKGGLCFLDAFTIPISPMLWTPYGGISAIIFVLTAKNRDTVSGYDVWIYFSYIIDMILWWCIVCFGLYEIVNIKGNLLLPYFDHLSSSQITFRLFSIVFIYIVCCLVAKGVDIANSNRWKRENDYY